MLITRKIPHETDEVRFVVDEESGIVDEFLFPPKITTKLELETGGIDEMHFEVVFRKNRISTFTRTVVRINPEGLPYVKDTRQIDCSIFGVEVR